jgi:hypothetical protein
VLAESRGQIAHQETRRLDRFGRVDQTLPQFGSDDSVGQTGGRWVCAPRRAPVGFGIVPSEKVVQNMTGIGQKVGRQGRPILREEGGDGLEGLERFFPRREPNIDLLRSVSEASVQSSIPSTYAVLHHPHQTVRTAFPL